MSIQDSFNLGQATASQTYAYKCWYNYNYGGNTMNISSRDMSEITRTWSGELKNWKTTATKDENKYEISDDDFSSAKNDGKANAKEKTGFNGKKGKSVTRGVADIASGAVGTIASTLGKKIGISAAETAAKKAAEKASTKAVEKALAEGATKQVAKKAGEEAAKKSTAASSNIGFVVAAPLALATGTAYMVKKPNKVEKEACDALQDEMVNAQAAISEAQVEMENMDEELVALSEEAQENNEEANDEIEEDKTEFDLYKASYDALMEKVNAGEPLSEDEKSLLEELIPVMQELGVNIKETSEETSDTVTEIHDEMSSYQDGFDAAAATMGEVEGLTDYAEGFDEATRTMCYVEAGAQGLNAASGATAAMKASMHAASGGIFGLWALPFVAMGTAGAAMSGTGAIQQINWAGAVGKEIELRKDTQDLNVEAADVYTERIDNYEGYMENVEENLTLAMPDDIEAPTEAIPQTGGEDTASTTNTFGIPPEKEDKEKEK